MPRPAPPPGPIITLAYRVPAARRAALIAFLGGAFDVYERPPGVRMALYESADDPELVVEVGSVSMACSATDSICSSSSARTTPRTTRSIRATSSATATDAVVV